MQWRWLLPLLFVAGAAHAQGGPAPAFPHGDGANCAEFSLAAGTDEEGNAQDCFVVSSGAPGPFLPEAGGELRNPGHLAIAGRQHRAAAPYPIYLFSDAGAGYVTAHSIDHDLAVGDEIVIRGTTNYNGPETVAVAGADYFNFLDGWDGDQAPATWSRVLKLPASHGAPDVSEGSWFVTNDGAGYNYDDFSWGCVDFFDDCSGGCPGTQDQCVGSAPCSDNLCDSDGVTSSEPTEFGHVINIRISAKATFHCVDTFLDCGINNITLWPGDWIEFTSVQSLTGGGSDPIASWKMTGLLNNDQYYDDTFVPQGAARMFHDTHIDDLRLHGLLDLGEAVYLALDDTTPSLLDSQGRQHTIFYSFECNDAYDKHCVDLYDSPAGGPCGAGENELQCSGSPDLVCDSDGISDWDKAPHRVGSTDTFCDADGTTAHPNTPGSVIITDFDDGTDGQFITVSTTAQELGYDCTNPELSCGTIDIPAGDNTTWWIYDAATDVWSLAALETFSDVVKVGLRDDQAISGNKTFLADLIAEGIFDIGTSEPLAVSATPSVADGMFFTTGGSGPPYTNFLDGVEGQVIVIWNSGDIVSLDCTSTNLECGSTDIPTQNNDVVMLVKRATKWKMIGPPKDNDIDMNLSHYALSAHTIASHSDTTATGPELEELTDGSTTSLHAHSGGGGGGGIGNDLSCRHTFTTETAGDIILCGKADGDITLAALNCTALGSTTPVAQIATVVECTSGGATCVSSGGTITAAAVETNYEDAAFTDSAIDDNDWWGIELTSYTTRADYLNCGVDFTRPLPKTECQHTFTTETAGDIIMCGKADGAIALSKINCTALGATTPVAQVVNIVECTSAGATCAASGGTITAAALETDYEDAALTDSDVDDNDWWGLELTSYTTRADYLNCQVEYVTP